MCLIVYEGEMDRIGYVKIKFLNSVFFKIIIFVMEV